MPPPEVNIPFLEEQIVQLNLELIRIDGGTQPRAELRNDVVNEYAELMRAGAAFPPVTVFYDGQDYWLADGFHRFHAWRRAQANQPLEVEVIQGTLDDARWYSYGVNKTHGLRRTNQDKERAVRTALLHPRAAGLSNVQIAEHCGVTEKTVRKYRQQSEATSEIPKSGKATPLEGTVPCPPASPPTTEQEGDAGDKSASRSGKSRPRTGRDGRTINTAKIGKRRRAPSEGPRISPRARPLIRGHSAPLRMIPLDLCPDNPHTAAATLWQFFSREFCEALVRDLSQFLSQQGEHECLFPPTPTTIANSTAATST